MIKISNVLVATDFSEASIAALAYGREFARMFGARLHVLHVVDNAATWVGPDAIGVDLPRVQREMVDSAREGLDRIVTAEDRTELNALPVVVTGGSPAVEIAGYAQKAGIDLIVMGTHGRGWVGHFLMGNIAEKTVRIAPCPVLTVRHPEREFLLPDALQLVEKAAG